MCSAINIVCVSVDLYDECVTNFYILVCVFVSCVIPCNNINTISPLSNILNITKQVVMLLLHLLCVIYLQFCSFHFFHSEYTAEVDWVCGSSLLRPAVLSEQGGMVMCQTNDRCTVTPNTLFDTMPNKWIVSYKTFYWTCNSNFYFT